MIGVAEIKVEGSAQEMGVRTRNNMTLLFPETRLTVHVIDLLAKRDRQRGPEQVSLEFEIVLIATQIGGHDFSEQALKSMMNRFPRWAENFDLAKFVQFKQSVQWRFFDPWAWKRNASD